MSALPSLDAAERRQRAAVAATACAGRRVLLLGEGRTGDHAALREAASALELLDPAAWLTAGAGPGDALVALDGPPDVPEQALGDALAAAAQAGAVVVLALPVAGPALLRVSGAVAAALPGALRLTQHAAAVAWVDGATPDPPDAPRWTLVVAGGPSSLTAPEPAAAVSLAATHLDVLEQAAAELRRANTGLARHADARPGAAAAAVLHQVDDLRQQLRDTERRVQDAERAAASNDALFQDARARLATRPHRVTAGVVHRARRLAGLRPGRG